MASQIMVFHEAWTESDVGSYSGSDGEAVSGNDRFALLKRKVMKQRLKGRKKKKLETASIWRVPRHWRNLQAEAYEPTMVSIGPLHHGKTELRAMEKVKLQCLCYLLDMLPRHMLDSLLHRVEERLAAAKDFYSEKIKFSDDELAEMLVLDGCFIVTVLYASATLGNHEILQYIRFLLGFSHLLLDLMLLENQIPFFLLHHLALTTRLFNLFANISWSIGPVDLVSISLKGLNIELPLHQDPRQEDVLHFLHLLHLSTNSGDDNHQPHQQSYWRRASLWAKSRFLRLFCQILCENCSGESKGAEKDETPSKIPSAVELVELGVRLQTKKAPATKQPFCWKFCV